MAHDNPRYDNEGNESPTVSVRPFQPGYWLLSVDDAGGSFRLRIHRTTYFDAIAIHNEQESVAKTDYKETP